MPGRCLSRLSLLTLAVFLAGCAGDDSSPTSPTPPATPSGRFVAENVLSLPQFPVAFVFTGPSRLLVTEKGGFGGVRSASVRVVESETLLDEPLITFRDVQTRSEMGLLGIAVSPDYAESRLVYAYYTHGPSNRNRVVRFRDDRLGQGDADAETVRDDLPADVCGNHQGGSLAFGPDGMLYVSVGDNGCEPCNGQDPSTVAGKLLRFTPDGAPAPGNPVTGSAIFASGLRNSFDFTFHPRTGEIFATENGPDANDEINRILPGGNYGWPYFQCESSRSPSCPFGRPRSIPPLRCYPTIIAPTGIVFNTGLAYPEDFRGDLFFGDFNNGTLHRLVLSDDGSTVLSADDRFLTGFGRIVDLALSPDGLLYVLTDGGIERIRFVLEE